jgi:hypothetical protein
VGLKQDVFNLEQGDPRKIRRYGRVCHGRLAVGDRNQHDVCDHLTVFWAPATRQGHDPSEADPQLQVFIRARAICRMNPQSYSRSKKRCECPVDTWLAVGVIGPAVAAMQRQPI